MSKLFSTCILLFLSIPILFGQSTLHGKVTDLANEPIPYVTIFTLEDSLNVVECDADGFFTLHCNATMPIHVVAQILGYERKVTVVRNEREFLSINLNPSNVHLTEIEISANRVSAGGPFTKSDLNRQDIASKNVGVDMPFVLENTPSMTVASDGGTGIGYTSMRMRGSDQTRINVTINGAPLNEPESHTVYWVDLPDLASSTTSIQIQRGIGPSTNGPGALGGTIAIDLNDRVESGIKSVVTLGSFGTKRVTLQGATGLLYEKLSMQGRVSWINSDGYLDRAWSKLISGNLSSSYIWNKSSLQFNWLGGQEKTYQAWWGVPESRVKNDIAQLTTHYYNNLGSIYKTSLDSVNLFSSDRRYNYYTYPNQIDHYTQHHVQVIYNFAPSIKQAVKWLTYYRRGAGFYEQLEYQQDGVEYVNLFDGIQDIVRRRWLTNDLFGTSLNYASNLSKDAKIELGIHGNHYIGHHFGRVVQVGDQLLNEQISKTNYYLSNGEKSDISAFGRAEKKYKSISLTADIQWRYVNYFIDGNDQDFPVLNEHYSHHFFNPKFGVSYAINEGSGLYASVAKSSKEPSRSDLIDSPSLLKPKHETLIDFETGYHKKSKHLFFQTNFYGMYYKDQLVLTGALNDVGTPLRQNVDKSYRIGLETSANYRASNILSIFGNLTVSSNKVIDFQEIIYDYTNGFDVLTIDHHNTDIAFSPDIIAMLGCKIKPIKHIELDWNVSYVGRQFLDNTSQKYRSISPYSFQNVSMQWNPNVKSTKKCTLGISIRNIFNSLYSANGYTYSYKYGDVITENFLYPQAGRHGYLTLMVEM